jgi:hypothetical protein
MIAKHLQELDGESQAYLFGAPRLYWSFGTMEFLAPGVQGSDVLEPLQAPPDFVDGTRDAIFVFLPERTGELAFVAEAFPGGETREFYDGRGELRFTIYTRAAQ